MGGGRSRRESGRAPVRNGERGSHRIQSNGGVEDRVEMGSWELAPERVAGVRGMESGNEVSISRDPGSYRWG